MATWEDDIQADIEDRKNTLLSIKTIPLKLTGVDKSLIETYSILAVYAVWEGFIRVTFETYIRQLNSLRLKRNLVANDILVFVMDTNFKQINDYPADDRVTQKLNLFNKLETFYGTDVLQIPSTVNTQSNVQWKVLNDLLQSFVIIKFDEFLLLPQPLSSLDFDLFKELENKYGHFSSQPDKYPIKDELKSFVSEFRNSISHGNIGDISITPNEIYRFSRLVEFCMDEILEKFKKAYFEKSYLKLQ